MRQITLLSALSLLAVTGCATTESKNPPPTHVAPYQAQTTAQLPRDQYQMQLQQEQQTGVAERR